MRYYKKSLDRKRSDSYANDVHEFKKKNPVKRFLIFTFQFEIKHLQLLVFLLYFFFDYLDFEGKQHYNSIRPDGRRSGSLYVDVYCACAICI